MGKLRVGDVVKCCIKKITYFDDTFHSMTCRDADVSSVDLSSSLSTSDSIINEILNSWMQSKPFIIADLLSRRKEDAMNVKT
ncbi:hypothetical protein YC2023_060889 [Brassica napus]